MTKYYIGTSGYYYKSWDDVFYFQNVKDRLKYYAKYFSAVEINATFYRIFPQDYFKKMIDKTPEDFKIFVKVKQTITHIRDGYYKDEIKNFNKSIRPLMKDKRYGGILLQFPYSFKYNKENVAYLEKLIRYLPINKAIEFRHNSWASSFIYNFLHENNIALVNVDMPQMDNLFPIMNIKTANFVYYRLHGRLKDKWWEHKEPYERYNYYYSNEEIDEIQKRIVDISKNMKDDEAVYIFFNNHYQAKAVKNAIQLGKKLGIQQKTLLVQDSLF